MRPPKRALVLGILAAILIAALTTGSWATLSERYLGPADWRSLIVGGLARGSVYAIIAVGYTRAHRGLARGLIESLGPTLYLFRDRRSISEPAPAWSRSAPWCVC